MKTKNVYVYLYRVAGNRKICDQGGTNRHAVEGWHADDILCGHAVSPIVTVPVPWPVRQKKGAKRG